MIRHETKQAQAGSEAVIQRLSDVLAIQLLRAVITSNTELVGPLAALHDRQRARMLLKNTQLSLELIAEQLGYQSATAFSRFFKRYEGVPASSYR